MAAAREPVAPLFLAGPAGNRFALYHAPTDARALEAVIYVPPFAEEMNRARRMAHLQATAFAASGLGVLLLDLFGTGDSDGDFGDATGPGWLADIASAADWLQQKGFSRFSLWGLRSGALLAMEAAASAPGRFSRIALWQPVADGKSFVTQFLRIRVAAAMGEGGETTERLRGELAAGRAVEVAGYELSPALSAALDGIRLDRMRMPPDVPVHWFELAAEPGGALLPAGQRIVQAWRDSGMTVSGTSLAGPQFWSTQDVTIAPALIEATTAAFAKVPA